MKAKTNLRICVHAMAAALAVAPAAHSQALNVLHSFQRDKLGYQPQSGVTIGPNGELYGTAPFGGASGLGLVYELLPPRSPGGAWTEVVLHSSGANDGQSSAALLAGHGGALYGVAATGGANGQGTAFELKPPAGTGTHWRETILHAFANSNGDGLEPEATPALGPHGVLYGTTANGGSAGSGTVYSLSPPSTQGGAWTEEVLYHFPGYAGDGTSPTGQLALAGDGTIYGTTEGGGTGASRTAFGTVFQLTPPTSSGGAWTEALLYSFSHVGALGPNGVVLAPGGILYGSTIGMGGGTRDCQNGLPCGTVFQLTPPETSGALFVETTLHTFVGDSDGWQPNSIPVLGPGGVLYGTTRAGGTSDPSGGTIYEMLPPSSPGEAWTEVILYSFPGNASEGAGPNAVTLGPDGNLYGTTELGGAYNQGTVFQLVLQ
jgi:uncharacterized repeat protein (TIGR03803 family)